jgi:hypothetical protein
MSQMNSVIASANSCGIRSWRAHRGRLRISRAAIVGTSNDRRYSKHVAPLSDTTSSYYLLRQASRLALGPPAEPGPLSTPLSPGRGRRHDFRHSHVAGRRPARLPRCQSQSPGRPGQAERLGDFHGGMILRGGWGDCGIVCGDETFSLGTFDGCGIGFGCLVFGIFIPPILCACAAAQTAADTFKRLHADVHINRGPSAHAARSKASLMAATSHLWQ